MILHNDKDAFRVLLERISAETGHREDVLERDYYVTLILKELSTLQEESLPAYFKRGILIMKRFYAFIIAVLLIVFLTACAGFNNAADQPKEGQPE